MPPTPPPSTSSPISATCWLLTLLISPLTLRAAFHACPSSSELEEQKRREHLAELKGEHVNAEWGSQIRSYVLHPYQMVKDHRSEYETGNTAAVLDGRLDEFMQAYLRSTVGQPA
jgi:hypothetical protein